MPNEEELRAALAGRLSGDEARRLARDTDPELLAAIMLDAAESRAADNAAWALTHLPSPADGWLSARQADLIDLAMRAAGTTRRRLALTLLLRTDFGPTYWDSPDEADARRKSAFLDFCLAAMASPSEPPGVQAAAIKLAGLQCRHYPELADELRRTLQLTADTPLTPATRCARRHVLAALGRCAQEI